ncbi:major facilitator superfamily domain-containing protein [Boeremia exigua]|uniref:major facilitator superfamily domain-containing protein n=1 Tax=Boeremia exigua TaxID=749465 RepID=UPI001E8E3ED7|nr:major facilitator superfamily domain-containing protein [Boeremia exigua]KAH6629007.1 major facilitator superfamily domain-containing protein [Boeremia exigua]
MQAFPKSTPSSRRSSITQAAFNASQYSFAETAVQSPNASCATFAPAQSSSTLAVNGPPPSKPSSLKCREGPTPHVERQVSFGQQLQQITTSDFPSNKDRPIRPTLQSCPSEFSTTPSEKWTRTKGFWRSFIAMCLPLLLSALEGSVTNTALPTISDALNLGTKFSWVATAFLLASTIFQPLYSQLGDMWGRKIPMMTAVTVFAIGSAICGVANSGAVLIFGRIVQGFGTGGIDLFAEMILCDIVPLRKRGPYLAIKHIVFSIGTCLGPLLGGVFAELNWRWCFYVNIPVCFVAFVIIYLWLDVGGGMKAQECSVLDELKRVDYLGTGLLTFSVVMLLISLSTGGAPNPWSHWSVITPGALGLVGFVGLAFWERSARCKYPIMPPHVFSNRTTVISFALTTIHGFITYGFQFYLPPFFQAVKGSSPSQSGVEVMPTTLAVVVCAAVGGPLMSLWGKYKPMHIIGFGIMTTGLSLCVLLGPSTPISVWLVLQLVVAGGLGIVISTMLPAVQVKLPESSTGAAAGSWAFLRGTGSLFGVAIPGAVFNVRFTSLLPTIGSKTAQSQLAKGQAYQHASAAFVSSFGAKNQVQIVNAFNESLKSVWIVYAVLAGIGFLMTFGEKQYKMRKQLNTKYGLKSASQTPSQTPSPIDMPKGLPTAISTPGFTRCDGTAEYPMMDIPLQERPKETV